MNRYSILAAAAVSLTLAQPSRPADAPKGTDAFRAAENKRRAKFDALQAEVRSSLDKLRDHARADGPAAKAKVLKDALAPFEAHRNWLDALKLPWKRSDYELYPQSALIVGDRGYFPGTPRLAQILADDKALLSWGRITFLVQGLSFAGMADGETVTISPPLEVTGTYQYTTVLGAARTVMALRPLDTRYPDTIREPLDRKINELLAEIAKEQETATKLISQYKSEAAALDRAVRNERSAASKLDFAKAFLRDGQTGKAREWLGRVVKEHPGTKEAQEAERLLKNPNP
jgi:hypothetical protein